MKVRFIYLALLALLVIMTACKGPEAVKETPDWLITAEQAKQMMECCGDGLVRQPYDKYGYKPRPQTADVGPQSTEPQPVPLPTEKKTSKR